MATNLLRLSLLPHKNLCFSYSVDSNVRRFDYNSLVTVKQHRNLLLPKWRRHLLQPHLAPNLVLSNSLETKRCVSWLQRVIGSSRCLGNDVRGLRVLSQIAPLRRRPSRLDSGQHVDRDRGGQIEARGREGQQWFLHLLLWIFWRKPLFYKGKEGLSFWWSMWFWLYGFMVFGFEISVCDWRRFLCGVVLMVVFSSAMAA